MDALVLHPPIAAGLRKVETRIQRLSASSTLPGINAGTATVVDAGGKRLRPALTLATALGLGRSPDRRVVTAAACVELIHAGSLVHDDLMDHATRRRGATTLNASLGDGKALLIGDFMLARAGLAALTSVSRPVAEVLAATVVELAEGQYLETAELFDAGRTEESALRSITGKTAALFRASCLVGAICAQASPEERAGLATYGERFGLVFQILDDLLDLTATSEQLGKPASNDLRQGVLSLPAILTKTDISLHKGMNDDEVRDAIAALKADGLLETTEEYCRALAADALSALPTLRNSGIATIMHKLPTTYLEKVLETIRRPALT
ncbi:polyprenyl synthetase family protein [Nonomuraea longicatena]|uniref:Polyprenyl synthetase family protein n=1 Tax=Nonomuraea longicatena TaxID=83682 RepID=A0ABN1NSK3_9ACTN